MKNLLIMRHAKSSWGNEALADYDRPLNKRGLRDAPRMGKLLVEKGLVPDCVIGSSANRAQSTAKLVIDNLGQDVVSRFTEDLYHAPAEAYLEYISIMGQPHSTILMVGHNPGIERLVYSLSDRWEIMPTAAIAWFQFDSETWEPIEQREPSRLRAVWRPKELYPE